MKACFKCKQLKPNTEFGKNRTKKDGLQTSCKQCTKDYNKSYYKRTPEKNAARRANSLKQRQKAREFVWRYLETHSCVDCGESDPVVLEFDHIRDKKYDISSMISASMGVETIEKEIAKCEVRCANCHRRITAKRAGWTRSLIG